MLYKLSYLLFVKLFEVAEVVVDTEETEEEEEVSKMEDGRETSRFIFKL